MERTFPYPRRCRNLKAYSSTAMDSWLLAIDEVDGTVYVVPKSSMELCIRTPIELSSSQWKHDFVSSPKDSTCFVNSETLSWVSNQQLPCAVLKTIFSAQYIYVHVVCVFDTNESTNGMGSRFLWPLSYHGHDCVWSKVANSTVSALSELDPYPPLKKSYERLIASEAVEQRPRPKHILGAVPLSNFNTQMSICDRRFFLQAITGQFVFRDATECISSFVQYTRQRKETHPVRNGCS